MCHRLDMYSTKEMKTDSNRELYGAVVVVVIVVRVDEAFAAAAAAAANEEDVYADLEERTDEMEAEYSARETEASEADVDLSALTEAREAAIAELAEDRDDERAALTDDREAESTELTLDREAAATLLLDEASTIELERAVAA